MEKYYLSSLKSRQLQYVRKCEYIREIKFNTGKLAVIVKLSDYLKWKDENGFHCSDYAIIKARHEGYNIINISKFPIFVYVTVLKNGDYDYVDAVSTDDLINMGIGELYATFENAENHVFDK